jgi:putative ABC transport system permease protein
MHWSEAFKMAMAALRANKLRSALTLVGIIAGVASIIAVMTGISVVQSTMERELSVLGTQTFQVQKWPRGFHGDNNWRKIQRRPPVTVEQADAIREHVKAVDMVGAELWQFGATARYEKVTTDPRMTVCGCTPEYSANNTHYVASGRNLNAEDMSVGRRVAVIGPALADKLFPFTSPLDKEIRVDGMKLLVIGVLEKKDSTFGGGFDNYILIPVNLFGRMYGMRDNEGGLRSVNVTVRARTPELLADAIAETKAVLRITRGIKPGQEDDFELFTNDSQIKQFNEATSGVKLGAFVIGAIALLVAGIGIMNIMLVSVTERTREIGIRKALGAKRRNILAQFLLEAVVLCNLGGVVGVAVGFGLGNIVTFFTDFSAHIPVEWAVRGVVFCTVVGLTFGLWPAMKASRLAPVEALRYE